MTADPPEPAVLSASTASTGSAGPLGARTSGIPASGTGDARTSQSRTSEIELFSLAGHDGHLRQVNAAFERLLGVAAGAAEGRSLLEFVHPQDLAHVVEGLSLLEGGAQEVVLDNRFLLDNGSVVHLQWIARPLQGSDLWWAAGRDISEFRRALAVAGDLKTQLALAVGSASAAMWDLDPWTRTFTWEAEAAAVLGLAPGDAPLTAADLLAVVGPPDRAAVSEAIEQLRGRVDSVEVDFRVGEQPATRYLRLRGKTVERDRHARGRRAIGLIVDVSAEKAMQEQMLTMVMSDALTGVPNRRAFDQTLRSELRRCTRTGEPLSVVMVDVDDFKRFNDTFGHMVGDDVLCTVSRALSAQPRPDAGILARFGGEEFSAVLPGIGRADAATMSEALVLSVRGARLRQAPEWPLTISAGTATWSPGEPLLKPAELLDRADRALYVAKNAGKDRSVAHGAAGPPAD